MIELTEREEREMIDRAKAGDPEANYTMSLWALDRAMEEPGEERWNRLAAKCLVKSAQAGYAPAQKRMAELMKNPEPEPEPASVPEDDFDWSAEPVNTAARSDLRHDVPRTASRRPDAARADTAPAGAAARIKRLFSRSRTDRDDTDAFSAGPSGHHRSGRRSGGILDFSGWDDRQWKKMRLICSIICVVLAVLIGIMIVTGRKTDAQEEEATQLPAAATAVPAEATPTPSPIPFPDAAVRAEIEAADLDIFPTDEDYLSGAAAASVSAGSGLKLRRGPNTSYSQIVLMAYNSTVEVYAERNGWSFVKYTDGTWGWCSSDYLK